MSNHKPYELEYELIYFDKKTSALLAYQPDDLDMKIRVSSVQDIAEMISMMDKLLPHGVSVYVSERFYSDALNDSEIANDRVMRELYESVVLDDSSYLSKYGIPGGDIEGFIFIRDDDMVSLYDPEAIIFDYNNHPCYELPDCNEDDDSDVRLVAEYIVGTDLLYDRCVEIMRATMIWLYLRIE